ncbi:NAD-dependent succinate-semialdehyde dehydrogenase [Brevibacterium aurantiacum]|uniref:Succinate-semialdehyde dehydrogenase / glutarate-semialdehyde dehydrogenase n=1 Tax=Brevibacterium aurantiacum TaxID=273384 RepID=A0A2H1HXH2_BREAU|nr:NAD-dependent succinate-semialdehyde dehydrogenase [Brevibacterium aurantiacum]AZL10360.1 NAD-dependent succinate-semialdehyde dehydrogenase [Brevibacterium aurantiacum]PCC57551.1 succinate-semialdehyde dehydrogenase [Brevibacterium aurantiacum]SMX62420.1 succinate-semialdehyde dehydrogenase / glutarate-semialdehyde dehydrogenase [Brevibacterium aurantiacum]SMX67582.1 succinate-semialdehyde dehydrogenase / glutarate-semialdehyde dehydrogenase [Brevibacterium aurantiacum]GEB22045.1 succinate
MSTMYRVTNPATGEVAEEFATATDSEILAALDRSATTFTEWSQTSVADRAAILVRVSEIYAERAEELAKVIQLEMGKAVPEGKGEVGLSSAIYRYFADNAEAFMADEPLRGPEDGTAMIRRKPVGSLLGIMPWNFPYYQVARFAAPNLALGNTILLKHAPQCPRSAQIMEEIFIEAGLPEGAYINIYASNEQVADIILPDPRNHGVSLTGSERAGAAVAAEAGKNLKKVVLELGGSDPYILLDTADVSKSANTFFKTRMGNTGQACNSPKRMIVMDDVYDEFLTSITEAAKKFTPEAPDTEGSRLSPLSSTAAADRFIEQVQDTVKDGATLLAGGKRYDGGGAYVEPVVLADVEKGMRGYYEELFGPAVIVYKVSSEEEAVEMANDTPFGLGAAVFSNDLERAERVGSQIDSGMVFLNAPEGTREYLPFGGVKRSGVGRELGPLAMDEFVNKQMVFTKN